MSALDVATRKALIIAAVGDVNTVVYPTGILAENIDSIWDAYEYVEVTNTELHDLLVKRDCILLVIGAVRNYVDNRIAGDSEVKSHQVIDTLMSMLQDVKDAIKTTNNSIGAMAATLITTVAPESRPTWWAGPDANNPRYGGDPYRRPRRGLV
jgi:hypothetical protein